MSGNHQPHPPVANRASELQQDFYESADKSSAPVILPQEDALQFSSA